MGDPKGFLTIPRSDPRRLPIAERVATWREFYSPSPEGELRAQGAHTTEVITGDMPTPVKYYNDTIRRAYKEIEATAGDRLLAMLPEEFRPDYDPCFHPDPADKELWQLVKAADKISALIKCIEEDRMGNREFEMALRAQEAKVEAIDLPEVAYFRKEFMPAYYLTLDEHTKS